MNRAGFAQHTDNLGLLRDLVDSLGRHKEIVKAHEEAQEILALTDEQLSKINELKELKELNEKQSLELEKQRTTLENLKTQNALDLADLDNQRKSLADSLEKVREEKEATQRASMKNEELKKQLENEKSVLAKTKSDYEEKNAKLDEREKALDVRAEKILLREKATPL